MNDAVGAIAAIVVAILGVAIVAVLVGQNAQTASVITSGGTALSSVIQAAVAPVSGSSNHAFG